MNGIENESFIFSHAFARDIDNMEIKARSDDKWVIQPERLIGTGMQKICNRGVSLREMEERTPQIIVYRDQVFFLHLFGIIDAIMQALRGNFVPLRGEISGRSILSIPFAVILSLPSPFYPGRLS
jgi:hypothetical protein